MLLQIVAASTGALAVFAAVGALSGQWSLNNRKVAARTMTLQRGEPAVQARSGQITLLKDDVFGGNATLRQLLGRFGWAGSRATLLERADLPLKVSEYLLILIGAFAGATVLASLLSGLIFVGLAFGVVAVVLIEVWAKSRAKRRLALFDKQLPVALQVMATSLRSGFGIMEALQTVSREMEAPLATEFKRIIDDARVGGSFEMGVAALVERIDSQDLRIVARALEIHRRVGGDLASILEGVAETMREREELRGHIIALTAQQRFGGLIVGLMPLWVIGFFLLVDPEFIAPLWRTNAGHILLGTGLTMETVAFFVMRRLLTIEV